VPPSCAPRAPTAEAALRGLLGWAHTMRHSRRAAYTCSLFGLSLVAGACSRSPGHAAPTPPAPPAATLTPGAGPPPAPSTERAAPDVPSCSLGGAAVVRLIEPGHHVTDVRDVAAAATKDAAMVTFDVEGDDGAGMDGSSVSELQGFRVDLRDAALAPGAVVILPAATSGISSGADAAPFALGGTLLALTQGHHGHGGVDGAGDPPDTIYVVGDGKLVVKTEKWFSGRFAAQGLGATGLAIGAGNESGWWRTGAYGVASVRLFRLSQDRPPEAELLVKKAGSAMCSPEYQGSAEVCPPTDPTRYDAPAIAGSDARAAVAFRHKEKRDESNYEPGAARSINVAWVDPRSGKALAPPAQVAKGDVGAPAIVVTGTTLHVVWSQPWRKMQRLGQARVGGALTGRRPDRHLAERTRLRPLHNVGILANMPASRTAAESARPWSRLTVFRPRDVAADGVSRTALGRLVAAGTIERLGRGLYAPVNAKVTAQHTLVEAARRVPRGVICLLSALRFHGLTTQNPHDVWTAIDVKARKPAADWPPIHIVRFSGEALTYGVEAHMVEGVELHVTSREKTVADCFKYRNKIGLDVALEALGEYLRGRRRSVDNLVRAADVCRVARVMRPYIESLA